MSRSRPRSPQTTGYRWQPFWTGAYEGTTSTERQRLAPAEAEKEPANTEAEKEPSTEKEDDSINSLFNQEDDEVNPLANLINSLPDVTAQELLDDLGEIKEIIREWERS